MQTGLTNTQGPQSDSFRMSQQAFGVGPEYNSSRNKLHVQGGEVTGEAWRVGTGYLKQAEQISKKLGLGKSEWSRPHAVRVTNSRFPERKFSNERSVESSHMYEGKLKN